MIKLSILISLCFSIENRPSPEDIEKKYQKAALVVAEVIWEESRYKDSIEAEVKDTYDKLPEAARYSLERAFPVMKLLIDKKIVFRREFP
jgi:hypothetical protein